MASRKNEESNSSLKISILFDLSFNVLLILKKLLFLVLPPHLRILKPENYRKIGDRRVGGVKIREEWDEGRMLETNSKDEDGEDHAAVNDFGVAEKSKYSTATKPVLLK